MKQSTSSPSLPAGYSVTGYQPKYREGVVERLGAFWRLSIADSDAFFRWKYQDCPFCASPHIVVLIFEGKVTGIRGAGMLPLYVNGVKTVAACMGDSWIDVEHREKGLFGSLTAALAELIKANGIDLILNTTPSDKVHDWSLKNGWQSLNCSEQLLYPVTREVSYSEFFDAFVPAMSQPLQLPEGRLVISETLFVDLIIALIDRLESSEFSSGIRLRRCTAFLVWRFLRPGKAYRFIYLFDSVSDNPAAEPVLLGFLVVTPAGVTSLVSYCIADWCFDDGVNFADIMHAIVTNFPGYSFTVTHTPEMLPLTRESQSEKAKDACRTLVLDVLETKLQDKNLPEQSPCLPTLFYQRGVMLDNV